MSDDAGGTAVAVQSAGTWRKIVILSDPHVVADGGRIIGIDPVERLRGAIRHVNRWHDDAALVIVLGDLVHDGDPTSYAAIRVALAGLRPPVRLLLGNHDWRSVFLAEFPSTPTDETGYVQGTIDIGPYTLITLDTLVEGASHGELCAGRLAWLESRLQAAYPRPVLVFLHHPPMATGFPGMDAVGLAEPHALRDTLLRYGNVRHIFAGHVHRTIGGSWFGIPFSIFKSTVHQQPMDLMARDSSLSVPEPGAYGIVLLGEDSVIVHTEDYEVADVAAGRTEGGKDLNT